MSSARAALELTARGFKDALPLSGGLSGWQQRGFPVAIADSAAPAAAQATGDGRARDPQAA